MAVRRRAPARAAPWTMPARALIVELPRETSRRKAESRDVSLFRVRLPPVVDFLGHLVPAELLPLLDVSVERRDRSVALDDADERLLDQLLNGRADGDHRRRRQGVEHVLDPLVFGDRHVKEVRLAAQG